MSKRSRDELMTFLDYMGQKGLIPQATASNRKASVGRLLSILTDEEAQDVTDLDIDDLVRRFTNLEGMKFSPGSLATYKSRLISSLEDFRNYLENPLGFRPSRATRDTTASKAAKARKVSPTPNLPKISQKTHDNSYATASVPSELTTILPIPLRANLTVHVRGLPFDLTAAEAKRISNVILAMAVVD